MGVLVSERSLLHLLEQKRFGLLNALLSSYVCVRRSSQNEKINIDAQFFMDLMCNQVGGKRIGDFVKLLEKEDVIAVALVHDVAEPAILEFVRSTTLAMNLGEVL